MTKREPVENHNSEQSRPDANKGRATSWQQKSPNHRWKKLYIPKEIFKCSSGNKVDIRGENDPDREGN
jgi:hypothetical protein